MPLSQFDWAKGQSYLLLLQAPFCLRSTRGPRLNIIEPQILLGRYFVSVGSSSVAIGTAVQGQVWHGAIENVWLGLVGWQVYP